jgi:hypothetical protein
MQHVAENFPQGLKPTTIAVFDVRTEQAAEKGLHSSRMPEKYPSGAKAQVDLIAFAARLKSCPVTKPSNIAAIASFSAACEARTLHQPVPFTQGRGFGRIFSPAPVAVHSSL